jgi:dimeric dUTPase (all-alpha-NTP-PPase superfamily)
LDISNNRYFEEGGKSMNLQYLFEIQAGLDRHIEDEHPVQENEDRLAKKILALQVELGELANELPEVFKFWSNKKNDYGKALKEYVDGLHFILGIGIELELNDRPNSLVLEIEDEPDLVLMFQEVLSHTSDLFWYYYHEDEYEGNEYRYKAIVSNYIKLGEMLGFTWEQIEQAYLEKNEVNHQRQVNGY